MKIKIFCVVALVCATTLIIGCSRGRSANNVAEAFLDSCLVDNTISKLSFSELDSTRHVSDSTIASLRKALSSNPAFKKNPRYGEYQRTQSLHYVTATYHTSNGDKAKQAFYIDSQHRAVICVKTDYAE